MGKKLKNNTHKHENFIKDLENFITINNSKFSKNYELLPLIRQRLGNLSESSPFYDQYFLLETIASFRTEDDCLRQKDPYRPFWNNGTQHSGNISNLRDEQIALLKEIVEKIQYPFLQIRIYDILHIVSEQTERISYIKKTIELSIKLSEEIKDIDKYDHRYLLIKRLIDRASFLSLLYKQDELINKVKSCLQKFLSDGIIDENNQYSKFWILNIIYESKFTDLYDISIGKCKEIIDYLKNHSQVGDYNLLKDYLEILAKFISLESGLQERNKIWQQIAEGYYSDHKNQQADLVLRIRSLENSLKWYNKISCKKNTNIVQNIQKDLETLNEEYTKGFSSFETKIETSDIEEIIAIEIEEFKHMSFLDVLSKFLLSNSLISEDHLSHDENSTGISDFIPVASYNNRSRKQETISNEERKKMKNFCFNLIYRKIRLEKLWYYIKITYDKEDIVTFVRNILINNPLVSENRSNVIEKGLCNGFEGDFLTSSHILSFQVEEILRNIIKNNSKLPVVVTRTGDGSQKDIDLNRILNEEKYLKVLSDSKYIEGNLLINLKYLLTDCYNIRNNIAHGLLDDKDFFTVEHLYLFWVIARMILYAKKITETPNK